MRIYKNSLYHSHKFEKYHPKINAYYFKEMREYHMVPHFHEEVEIMYVMEGSCQVQCERQWEHLVKGQLILIDSCVPHKLEVNHGARILNIEFTFSQIDVPFPSMQELTNGHEAMKQLLEHSTDYVILKDSENILSVMKNLMLELDYQQNVDQTSMMTALLIRELLMKIASLAAEAYEYKSTFGHPYVREAVKYMHEHYDQPLQINQISQVLNIHPNYLKRIFTASMGTTIIEYLTNLRMNKAMMLLDKTDIKIVDIASYIGISSSQYFSVLFKKYYGMSPAAYRRNTYREYTNNEPSNLDPEWYSENNQ